MTDQLVDNIPARYEEILAATVEMKFNMASDLQTGSLLKTLAASKPGGKFLELGTGTGLATSWLLDGMDEESNLVSIENSESLALIAKKYIDDQRMNILVTDAYEWILINTGERFDLIFADAMPGKYDLFEETIGMLNKGGVYVIDDMLPQTNWPLGHDEKVSSFIKKLESRNDLNITKLNWSTGIIIVVKK